MKLASAALDSDACLAGELLRQIFLLLPPWLLLVQQLPVVALASDSVSASDEAYSAACVLYSLVQVAYYVAAVVVQVLVVGAVVLAVFFAA